MNLILYDRIKKAFLLRFAFSRWQSLGPILLGFGTKNPTTVIFGFKHINTGFMQKDNI